MRFNNEAFVGVGGGRVKRRVNHRGDGVSDSYWGTIKKKVGQTVVGPLRAANEAVRVSENFPLARLKARRQHKNTFFSSR